LDEARRALALTRRIYELAVTPEGALLTLAELETMAEEELAREQEEREEGQALKRYGLLPS